MRSRGKQKDQSYVLYMLDQPSLSVVHFPVGELPGKEDTRQLATDLGLHVADKPDSQEICFVSEAGGYQEFLRKNRPSMFGPGEIVNSRGEVLAHHDGVAAFTVGQRRGIKVASKSGRALYVIRLEPASNRVVVGEDEELLARTAYLENVIWSAGEQLEGPIRVEAKIRYNMLPRKAKFYGGDEPRVVFDEPVRAITPGQTAVAYRGQSVLAGGTIVASDS